MQRKQKQYGFTLMETIVVIAILAIIAAMVFISIPNKSTELGSNTNKVLNDIRYAQSLSMARDQFYRIKILSNTTYQIQDENGTPIQHPGGSSTIISLDSGITFRNSSVGRCVAFDPRGVPCNCNNLTPLGNTNIRIQVQSQGSNFERIRITRETGYSYIL